MERRRKQLAGAVEQDDDSEDIVRLRGEIEAVEAEARRLEEARGLLR